MNEPRCTPRAIFMDCESSVWIPWGCPPNAVKETKTDREWPRATRVHAPRQVVDELRVEPCWRQVLHPGQPSTSAALPFCTAISCPYRDSP